jgi:hypothetical protein
MESLRSPLFAIDKIDFYSEGVSVNKGRLIKFDEIAGVEVRPTLVMLVMLRDDVILTLRSSEKVTINNLTSRDASNLTKFLKEKKPHISIKNLPTFISGKRVLLTDWVLPTRVSTVILICAVLVVLLLILMVHG